MLNIIVALPFLSFLSTSVVDGAFQTGISLSSRHHHAVLLPIDSFPALAVASDTEEVSKVSGDVSIVYCTGCRWMLRSAYYAQELLTTFENGLNSVTLIPSRPPLPGGMLFVTLDDEKIWDRKQKGRFPETKELKQAVRNFISPDMNLGHSDVSSDVKKQDIKQEEKCEECPDDDEETAIPEYDGSKDFFLPKSPHVTIKYCTGCKWLHRAAWYAQELLTTFQDDLNAVTLVPTQHPAGQLIVLLDDDIIWDRAAEGRHAEPKELKQRIRDVITPDRSLGHSDVKKDDQRQPEELPLIEEIDDDDDAAEMRNFYGVM